MNINLEWYALYYLVECKRKETNSFDKKSVFSVSKNKCTKIAREIWYISLEFMWRVFKTSSLKYIKGPDNCIYPHI